MTQDERRRRLIEALKAEREEYAGIVVPEDRQRQRDQIRALLNVRPPAPASEELLAAQDDYLSHLAEERGVVRPDELPSSDGGVCVWRGDITRLAADAVVNSANDQMMGCFEPLCGCVDSAIHTQAGMQLRADCYHFMMEQGHAEPVGGAKITYAYNLPARYVIHTVGPRVDGAPTPRDRELLASCYRSCLRLAGRHRLASVAFPCVSAGHGGFPAADAATVALGAVRSALRTWDELVRDVEGGAGDAGASSDALPAPSPRVVLVCHTEESYELYRALL
jgi:O-acetyl-ADP-ribose deacetylase (regulator of RNase III)